MTRLPRAPSVLLAMGGILPLCLVLFTPELAGGQLAPRPPLAPGPRVETPPSQAELMQAALASNPVVAPYPIDLFERGGRVVLRGVVGTKSIYDAAIRTAIASGIPFADELVIDTLAAHEVAYEGAAAMAAQAAAGMGMGAGAVGGFGLGGGFGAEPPLALPTYGATGGYPPPTYMMFSPVPGGPPSLLYPPPLFGRIDEPFLGFEPPVISYPPYWGALSARRLSENAAFQQGLAGGAGAGGGVAAAPLPVGTPLAGGPEPPLGTVDAQISPDGVVTLRGTVATMAERVALGQYLAQTPGVSQVINLLRVDPSAAPAQSPSPPPPPAPDDRPRLRDPDDPGDAEDHEADADVDVDADVRDSPLDDLPELAGLPIRVGLEGGIATLDGQVSGVLEAMAAYLAVKRHPEVVQVVDRLRFSVPIEPGANPLRSAPDRLDVEEYLRDQIHRHLSGLAQVDRVRLAGHRLDVQGRLLDPANERQAEATLRSTPVLRGFSLAAQFDPPL